MDSIKNKLIEVMLIPALMTILKEVFTRENYQYYGDKLFDLIEEFVKDTKTTIDDKVVLPVVAELREFMNIPDDASEPEEGVT